MADDFTGVSPAGNSKAFSASWSNSTALSNTFLPFPPSGQTSLEEPGYGEGGYGEGGYDAPSQPSTSEASPTVWASVITK